MLPQPLCVGLFCLDCGEWLWNNICLSNNAFHKAKNCNKRSPLLPFCPNSNLHTPKPLFCLCFQNFPTPIPRLLDYCYLHFLPRKGNRNPNSIFDFIDRVSYPVICAQLWTFVLFVNIFLNREAIILLHVMPFLGSITKSGYPRVFV